MCDVTEPVIFQTDDGWKCEVNPRLERTLISSYRHKHKWKQEDDMSRAKQQRYAGKKEGCFDGSKTSAKRIILRCPVDDLCPYIWTKRLQARPNSPIETISSQEQCSTEEDYKISDAPMWSLTRETTKATWRQRKVSNYRHFCYLDCTPTNIYIYKQVMPNMMVTYMSSIKAVAAREFLAKFKKEKCVPVMEEFLAVRNYLLVMICVSNGSRAGTLLMLSNKHVFGRGRLCYSICSLYVSLSALHLLDICPNVVPEMWFPKILTTKTISNFIQWLITQSGKHITRCKELKRK